MTPAAAVLSHLGADRDLVGRIHNRSEHFACDETIEAADDLRLRLALLDSSGDVAAGGVVVAHADDHDPVERPVRVAAAAPVESVADGLARRRRLRACSAELRERSFGVEPVGVVAGCDQQLGCGVRADAVQSEQGRVVLGNNRPQPGFDVVDLAFEEPDPLGEHL